MLIEGLDGRVLVVSASDSRYALHLAILDDGTRLHLREDLWQTPVFQEIGAALGDNPPVPSPRFYVTSAYNPSGKVINLTEVCFPEELRLDDGTIVRDYSLPQ
ncbi:hypothetical protein HYX12_03305 [Candidatus Woesearchaeota archaeon]|nr:hypothetical protein [Candidatus Woesearchaeota archaeon]